MQLLGYLPNTNQGESLSEWDSAGDYEEEETWNDSSRKLIVELHALGHKINVEDRPFFLDKDTELLPLN